MIRIPPRSTRTYPLFPYTTLFRSVLLYAYPAWAAGPGPAREQPQAEIHGLQRTSAAHSGLYHFGYVLGVGRGFAGHEQRSGQLRVVRHDLVDPGGTELIYRRYWRVLWPRSWRRRDEVFRVCRLRHDANLVAVPVCDISAGTDVYACRSIQRSEEQKSELQSLMRISYAVF